MTPPTPDSAPGTGLDLHALLAAAEAAVDQVEDYFCSNLGARPVVAKDSGTFATEIDLEIERRLRELLTRSTDLPVFGEEFGGTNPAETTCWVVDPIDGTTNYASGYPGCAILVALLHRGQPVVGVTDMPLVRSRVTATVGGGTWCNGARIHLTANPGGPVGIAFGSVIAHPGGTFPRAWRQLLLATVGDVYPTIRISGSVGVDLASTAAGVFGGTITFSPNVWDNAAGVLLIREAGGVVTDLAGHEWTTNSLGVLAGRPAVHTRLREVIVGLQPPADLRG